MIDPGKLIQISAAAVAAEQVTGCPAELLIAQCGLESAWGRDASGTNNLFGIKEYPGCFGRQLVRTTEYFTEPELKWFLGRGDGRTATRVSIAPDAHGAYKYSVEDWFATFRTLADCFAKRAQIWDQGPYAAAAQQYKQDHDLTKFVRRIGPEYATAPGYADSVLEIAREPNVTKALATARWEREQNVTQSV
jgi:flagellum-specific peptidoglycan hydrolase FlgJ